MKFAITVTAALLFLSSAAFAADGTATAGSGMSGPAVSGSMGGNMNAKPSTGSAMSGDAMGAKDGAMTADAKKKKKKPAGAMSGSMSGPAASGSMSGGMGH